MPTLVKQGHLQSLKVRQLSETQQLCGWMAVLPFPSPLPVTGRQPQPNPTVEVVAPSPLPHTVNLLDALEIILRQLEVVCLHVLVEGCHDGAGVVGVLQSQCVAQLVHSHQEEVIPCGEGDGKVPRAPT